MGKDNKLTIAKTMVIFITAMLIVTCFSCHMVSADSAYVKPFKSGKYYFKYDNGHVLYSKYKNKGYKKTPVTEYAFVTNGKDIVYLEGRKIKDYHISNKKIKTLKKLPKTKYFYQAVTSSNGYIWINKGTSYWSEFCTADLYLYNLNNNKIKLVKKNLWLMHVDGKYCVGGYGDIDTEKEFDIEREQITIKSQKSALYKICKNGKIKKIKDLGRVYTYLPFYYNNRSVLYYITNEGHTICSIQSNGKNKKVIKEFDEFIYAFDEGMYPTCYITDGMDRWEYNLKTEKRKLIEW